MTRGVTSTAERRERSQVTTAPTLILKSSTVSSHWILLPPLNLLQNFCCNKKGGRSYLEFREIYRTYKIPITQYFLIKRSWLPLISVEFWFSRWVTFIAYWWPVGVSWYYLVDVLVYRCIFSRCMSRTQPWRTEFEETATVFLLSLHFVTPTFSNYFNVPTL